MELRLYVFLTVFKVNIHCVLRIVHIRSDTPVIQLSPNPHVSECLQSILINKSRSAQVSSGLASTILTYRDDQKCLI